MILQFTEMKKALKKTFFLITKHFLTMPRFHLSRGLYIVLTEKQQGFFVFL